MSPCATVAAALAVLLLAGIQLSSAARVVPAAGNVLEMGKQQDALRYPSGPSDGHHSPPWPGYPGPHWGPSPPKHGDDELPLTSGMVVSIQSHTLQTFCNVGPADAQPFPYPLRCVEESSSLVNEGLLLVGKDFTDSKIYDGSVVQLKSQRENKICSYGAEEDRFPVTCAGVDAGPTSDFVIKRSLARPDLYILAPAIIPSHHCYPANAPNTDGVAPAPARADEPLAAQHVLVCDGQADGDAALLSIAQADFWKPPATVSAAAASSHQQGAVSSLWAWLSGLLTPSKERTKCHRKTSSSATVAPAEAQGAMNFPWVPSPPAAPGDFPFAVGSTLLITDPANVDDDAPVCDVLSTKGKDDDDDLRQVTCDRDPPPPSDWAVNTGFLVISKGHKKGVLTDGARIRLLSVATHRLCKRSAQPNGVMTCGEKNKTMSDVWFRLEAVDAPTSLTSSSSLTSPSKEGDATVTVEAHLLHEASGRYCAVDTEDFSLPLTCDFDAAAHGRPKVLIKVAKAAWPW